MTHESEDRIELFASIDEIGRTFGYSTATTTRLLLKMGVNLRARLEPDHGPAPTGAMRALLRAADALLPPPLVIPSRAGDADYLARYYLLGGPRSGPRRSRLFDWLPRSTPNIFLHRIRRSDDGPHLHSHPWKTAISVILAGGYSEERRAGNSVYRIARRPGDVVTIDAGDYHRVDLIGAESWSLFIAGPATPDHIWNFWDRHTGLVADSEDYKRHPSPDHNTPIWHKETT